MLRVVAVSLALSLVAAPVVAQPPRTAASWSSTIANEMRVVPNITYLTANNWDATLDVYTPNTPGPHPTILHIHGGGWTGGSKEGVTLRLLPYLEMGFAVVNATYRLARVSEAPAAVEDCRCALRWIVQHAKEYNFDPNRIITMGYSAGGHLALTTGMVTPAAGFDRQCPSNEPLEVAAIVNWYGITDVADLLLATIPDGKPGGFPAAQQRRAVDAVRAFLAKHLLMPKATAGTAP